jgi:hypothetical protein
VLLVVQFLEEELTSECMPASRLSSTCDSRLMSLYGKVATKDSPFNNPKNIFNMDKSRKRTDPVITEK